jgi:hypothetical protein
LLIIAFNLFVLGIIADLIGTNRTLIQELLYLTRRHQLSNPQNRSTDRLPG